MNLSSAHTRTSTRTHTRAVLTVVLLDPASEGMDDVKVKAVNEMMERIKLGVVLRPVKSQESKVTPAFIAAFFCLVSSSCPVGNELHSG